MIHQFRCSAPKKLAILAVYILMEIFFLCLMTVMLSGGHILGTLLFTTFFSCLAYSAFILFVRGRIHEIYLISQKTLAVIYPKRPVRFLKFRDFASYRPLFDNFGLVDGSRFACWIPGDEQKFAVKLIELWCGDSGLPACRASGTVDLQRLAFPDGAAIQRFPRIRPNWFQYAATYVITLLAIAIPIVSAIAYIALTRPQETETWLILSVFSAMYLSPVMFYFGVRCYNLFIRGDLYATIIISPRTLCVIHPRKPLHYVKRDQCAAIFPGLQPSSGCIELANGDRVGFGFADITSDQPGPTQVLWRRWWPFVPERLRVVKPVREYIALCMATVGLALALEGHANESDLRFTGGAALQSIAILYLCIRICGVAKYHSVPLSREYYSSEEDKPG